MKKLYVTTPNGLKALKPEIAVRWKEYLTPEELEFYNKQPHWLKNIIAVSLDPIGELKKRKGDK